MPAEKRTRGQSAGLTRESIANAALALIDKDGLTTLSMRAVAGELDVHVTSLYNHIADKEDLLDAVAEHLTASLPKVAKGLAWQDTLRSLARGLRELALAHPEAAPLLATRPLAAPQALAPVDSGLRALREAGLSEEDAVSTFWLLGSYLVGALIGEAASLVERREVSIGPDKVEAAAAAGELSTLAELSPWIIGSNWETEFERALELLIDLVTGRAGQGGRGNGKGDGLG